MKSIFVVCIFSDKICEYFGVKIAMYFAYLGHYTSALTLPAFLGLFVWLQTGKDQVRIYTRLLVPKDLTFSSVLTKQCGVVPGLVDRWQRLVPYL